MRKIIIVSCVFCILFSCDPEDSRLVFVNKTKDSLVVRMMFDKELPNKSSHWNRSRELKIKPLSESRVGIFNKWEGEFKRALPDTLLNIIVTPYYDFENDFEKWDSIYNKRGFYSRRISIESIKKEGWVIKYPENFKRIN